MATYPLTVFLLEDDDFSRYAMTRWFTRDIRTSVGCATDSLPNLIRAIERAERAPDVIVVDIDGKQPLNVKTVVDAIEAVASGTTIVFLSEYAELHHAPIQHALEHGANGFLDKDDVRYGLVTAVLQGHFTTFVYSESLERIVATHAPERKQAQHRFATWRLHPELSGRHVPVAVQTILYGLPAPLVADEIRDSNGRPRKATSISTYRNEIYATLRDGISFYDMTYLNDVWDQLEHVHKEHGLVIRLEAAFHLLTQPPRSNHPVYSRQEARQETCF